MPAYEYICQSCSCREVRIAGIDDHAAVCSSCGQPMTRRMDVASLLASYSPEPASFPVGS